MTSTFITSHYKRVIKANNAIKYSPEINHRKAKNAYVKFYLLEDILELYKYRLTIEEEKVLNTHAGEMAKARNTEKFKAVVTIFESVIEVAWSAIISGKYKVVKCAIKERALIAATGNINCLSKLRELAVNMLKELSNEVLIAEEEKYNFDKSLDNLEKYEQQYHNCCEWLSAQKVKDLIKEVEEAIPYEKARYKDNTY